MRSQDLKYLGVGLGIGALISGILLGGIYFRPLAFSFFEGTATPTFTKTMEPSATTTASPTREPSVTSTFTPTPTMLPSSTIVPSVTITLTSTELMIAGGEIAISGPLSREQHKRLYEASLTFIAPTFEQSRQMSAIINLSPYSDPSTICGPLSIAVLQRAGLLSEDLIPFDFFLINPHLGKDRQILRKAFPADLFKSTRFRISLNEFNWAADPLLPGDFIYIYSGSGGNFEHMLVVNRVDVRGRAYSVMNFNTEHGFVIDQVMLYDPHDPTAGIFAQWSRRGKQLLGSTGFAGFEVWRLKEDR
jgi:hypothetical protein